VSSVAFVPQPERPSGVCAWCMSGSGRGQQCSRADLEALWHALAMAGTTSDSSEFKWSRVSKVASDIRRKDYEGARQGISAASFVSGIAWLAVVLLLVAGVYLVTYEDPFTSSRDSFLVRFPLAVTGMILVVAGFVQLMVVVMVANFVKATLAFQAEAGTFFAAFKRGIAEGVDPIATAQEAMSKGDAKPSELAPELLVVPPNEIKSGSPASHEREPGWYIDPYGGIGHLRWWDGEGWSDKMARSEER
jgi:hypothetical protein